jgi:hypothetical protein
MRRQMLIHRWFTHGVRYRWSGFTRDRTNELVFPDKAERLSLRLAWLVVLNAISDTSVHVAQRHRRATRLVASFSY